MNSEGHVTSTGPHYKGLSPCRRGFATPFEVITNPTSRLNGISIWSAFSYLFANTSFLSYTIKPNQHRPRQTARGTLRQTEYIAAALINSEQRCLWQERWAPVATPRWEGRLEGSSCRRKELHTLIKTQKSVLISPGQSGRGSHAITVWRVPRLRCGTF